MQYASDKLNISSVHTISEFQSQKSLQNLLEKNNVYMTGTTPLKDLLVTGPEATLM